MFALLCFMSFNGEEIYRKCFLRTNIQWPRGASVLLCHQLNGGGGPSGGGGGFIVLCDVCRGDDDSEDESLSHGGRQNHDNLYRVHMPSLYSCGSSYGSETSIPAAAHTVSNAPVTEYMWVTRRSVKTHKWRRIYFHNPAWGGGLDEIGALM